MYLPNTRLIAENVRILAHVVQDVCEKGFLDSVAPDYLNRNQFTTLRILASSGPQRASDLADLLQISRAAATKNIEILVQHKLVKREVTETDRRTALISILSKGMHIVNSYEELRLNQQCNVLEAFSEEEQEEFARLMEKYINNCLIHTEGRTEIVCLQCNGRLGKDCTISKHKGECYFNLRKT